jgi:hypothetical protein
VFSLFLLIKLILGSLNFVTLARKVLKTTIYFQAANNGALLTTHSGGLRTVILQLVRGINWYLCSPYI